MQKMGTHGLVNHTKVSMAGNIDQASKRRSARHDRKLAEAVEMFDL